MAEEKGAQIEIETVPGVTAASAAASVLGAPLMLSLIHILNPGSVSIPKENSAHSYMTYEDGLFQWKDLDGTVYMEYRI